ncbi:DsbA family protein [Candidatus Liberibacter sp.]|uniref:DsbA family protein n=1 Tax=Candidatus Liberibacter sp. TaxID=34022 RepID=UPI0015F692A0|nr:DsbA family protein [Candidatus Liberibacter sp.]MBA5724143.1 DsbA family protein [Candidatus Liberibacter sp.]
MNIIKVGSALVIVVIIAVLFVYGGGRNKKVSEDLYLSDSSVDAGTLLMAGSIKDIAIGHENAPVTIVEYLSMTCFHCADFHTKTLEILNDKYIKTGKVRYILRQFPLDPVAMATAMLARCAEDRQAGGYLNLVSMLFKKQKDWMVSENPREALLNIVKFANFSKDDFESCIANQKILDGINADMKRAHEVFSIDSTPAFFVNGKLYLGARSADFFGKIIDRMLLEHLESKGS